MTDDADGPDGLNPWQSPRLIVDEARIQDETEPPWYRLDNWIGLMVVGSLLVPPLALAVTTIALTGPIVASAGGWALVPERRWSWYRTVIAVVLAWTLAMPCPFTIVNGSVKVLDMMSQTFRE